MGERNDRIATRETETRPAAAGSGGKLRKPKEGKVAPAISAASENGHRDSILLVDDREDNLVALETILKDLDQGVVTARSGQEALRVLFDQEFAVIILDVRMPDMDGFEAAQLIRKRPRSKHTPIIFITAADENSREIARGYSAGAVDFIFKPFVPEVLKAKVRIFLDLFHRTERLRQSEERFRLLVERVKDYAILMLDPAGRVMSWNEGAERIHGYRAEEIVGRDFANFFTPEDRERGRPSQLLKLAESQGWSEDEGWRVPKQGGRFWAHVITTAIRDDHGRLTGFGKVTRDLTEQKRTQEALSELSARLLEAQDKERRRISSELHNNTSPSFTSLVSKLYQVKKRVGSADQTAGEILNDSIGLAEVLSREIRTFAYLLYPPHLEQKGLLPSLHWYLDDFVNRTGIRVKRDLPQELQRLSADAEIAFFRITQECLDVVLKQPGVSQITVRLAMDQNHLCLELGEEGRSLPSHVLNEITKGLGQLGVSIAGMRERMKQLGGRLELNSSKSGALITATLPLRKAQAAS